MNYSQAQLPNADDGNTYFTTNGYQLTYYGRYNGRYYWYYTNGQGRYNLVESGTTVYREDYYDLYDLVYSISDPIETFEGLYGQKLSKYDYVWPTDYRWLNDYDGRTFTSIQDMFESSVNSNPDEPFHSIFYGYKTDMNTAVYHYLQNVDGSWPDEATYTIPTVVGNGMVFRNFQGFNASQFRIKLPDGVNSYQTGTSYSNSDTGILNNPQNHNTSDGWTDWLPYGTAVEYEGNNNHETNRWSVTEGGIEFRYTRNNYPLTYMVGRFENASGEVLDAPTTGSLKVVNNIDYESSLASYAEGGDDYYEPDQIEGYAFAGWYIDSTCTTPVDFENTTMPINGMTVYAKWVEAQYRVFLHPNTTDATLDWGSGNQAMNFRVSMNGTVSVPNGRRTGYELVGWYLDEACTQAFNADAFKLNEVTVTSPYDKTADFTDEMDKWGNGATWNADVDRFWITKKLDIYAKWRAVLEGADGIGVVYDANGGSNAPTDTTLYLDTAQAVAQGASVAPRATGDDPQHVFLYWVLQTWDEEQNKYVDVEGADHIYPGDNFEVLKENAKRVINEYYDDGVTIKSATYTVQLRAEYGDAESRTPTHIYWYANNSSGNVIKTNTVDGKEREFFQINEAMPVKNPLDFASVQSVDKNGYYHFNNDNGGSYKFLGWARIPEAIDGRDMKLGKDNLFLTWHEEDGGYYTAVIDGEEKRVSKVAADEVQPYHAMYAVWQRWGYIKIGKHFDVQDFYLDGVDMETRWNTLEFTIKDSDGNYVRLVDDPGTDVEGHYIYDGSQAASTTITLDKFVHETSSSNTHEHQYFIYAWVPIDTYIVEENHDQADALLTGYTRQNSAYSATATVANSCIYGELSNIGSGEARIDNNYRGSNNYAYLKVEKQVSGAPESLTKDKFFYFIVKNNTLNAYVSTEDRTFTTDTSKIQVYKIKPGGAIFYADTGNQVNGNHIQVIGDNSYSIIELDTTSEPIAATESPQLTGYLWEQSVSPASVTAAKDNEKTVTITNKYQSQLVDIYLNKVDRFNQTVLLDKAEFKLYRKNDSGVYATDETIEATMADTTLIVTNGVLKVEGLPSGDYKLTETKAPEGYVIMTKDLYFTVNKDAGAGEDIITVTSGQTPFTDDSIGASTKKTDATGDTLVIPNESGAELPSTGGTGTTIFYVLGILMIAGGIGMRISGRRRRITS